MLQAAWLPYWAEEATASLRAAAGPAVAQATAFAAEVRLAQLLLGWAGLW